MVNKEIKLKGSMHGVKNIKEYKKPDIINSVVDNHFCLINDIRIKYNDEKKRFYIYHSYNGLDGYSGRWYKVDYYFVGKDLEPVNKTFTIELKSVDWEDFETGKSTTKNVDIKIQLSDYGFNKLQKYFTSILK